MATADEKVNETKGRAVDGRIFRLREEIAALQNGPTLAELQAELDALLAEKAVIDPRRPRPITPPPGGPVIDTTRTPTP